MLAKKLSVSLWLCFIVLLVVQPAMADKLYTSTADFEDEGNAQLVNVDPSNDQLQLGLSEIPYPFVNIAATGRGTIVRIDAATGDIVGEYRTAPQGLSASPSRISVDSEWNAWAANQSDFVKTGDSVVKIGVVVGGTRVSFDEEGSPIDDLSGPYLKGPFDYNTCDDRDGDGFIRTSRGVSDALPWPNINDSGLNADGIVQDAEDECILLFKRLPDVPNTQHVSVDANDDVWVGGYPGSPGISGRPTKFYKLSGDNGAVLDSFDARVGIGFGCGGFGGLVDDSGILWSASWDQNKLLRYNPNTRVGECLDVNRSWGLAVDAEGFVWNSMGQNQSIAKIDASGISIEEIMNPGALGSEDRGVAVTPADNHVWVVKAGAQELRRFNSNGEPLASILLEDVDSGQIAREPTGLAVDNNGKLWVANRGRDNVMRIDPTASPDEAADGPGAVDRTVDLGAGAAPNSYSDMTKVMPISKTSPQGTWTVIHDGGDFDTNWDVITWNTEPEGTLITVEAQAANTEIELGDDSNYVPVSNGGPLSLTPGRFIKIRAILAASESGAGPVLYDLEVKSVKTTTVCDVNTDGIIDKEDIKAIIAGRRLPASGPDDPRDWNRDGTISVLDARGCVLECTNLGCSQ